MDGHVVLGAVVGLFQGEAAEGHPDSRSLVEFQDPSAVSVVGVVGVAAGGGDDHWSRPAHHPAAVGVGVGEVESAVADAAVGLEDDARVDAGGGDDHGGRVAVAHAAHLLVVGCVS